MAATKTIRNGKKSVTAKKAATTKAVAQKRTGGSAKKVAKTTETASRPSRDYTAPLTAVWVGLILVFLLLVVFKMYY